MNDKLKDKYTVVDLFSGCGGFSQGFINAGFEILIANEFWEPAMKTYEFNHKGTIAIEGDITLLETKQRLYDLIKSKKVNVVIGGPPCQAYSVAGNRNPDDPRGQLYLDFIEIVNHIKPDFFVMENVKGLLNMKHVKRDLSDKELEAFKLNCERLQKYKDLRRFSAQRELDIDEIKDFNEIKPKISSIEKSIEEKLVPLIDKILDKFKEIDYKVQWKILNSANFGVAQVRQRIIFLGTKHKDLKIKFPEESHKKDIAQTFIIDFSNNNKKKAKKWVSSQKILKRYEDLEENIKQSHVFTKHKESFIQRIKDTPIGKNVYENYTDSWWRLDPNRPARTVKENHGGVFIHYKLNRCCTPRELAALQSFSDDFIFKDSKSSVLKQIGNAIPPLMAKAIAEQIKTNLNEIYD